MNSTAKIIAQIPQIHSDTEDETRLMFAELSNQVTGVLFQFLVNAERSLKYIFLSPRSKTVHGLDPDLENFFNLLPKFNFFGNGLAL